MCDHAHYNHLGITIFLSDVEGLHQDHGMSITSRHNNIVLNPEREHDDSHVRELRYQFSHSPNMCDAARKPQNPFHGTSNSRFMRSRADAPFPH